MGSSVVSPCYAVTCGLLEVSYLSSCRPLGRYRMAFLYFLQCEVAVSQTSRRHFFPAVAAAGVDQSEPGSILWTLVVTGSRGTVFVDVATTVVEFLASVPCLVLVLRRRLSALLFSHVPQFSPISF